jgi:hypothetical protein
MGWHIAHGVGQVRDVLRKAAPAAGEHLFASLEDAVVAATEETPHPGSES